MSLRALRLPLLVFLSEFRVFAETSSFQTLPFFLRMVVLKDLYHADEYTLLDGDKTASVQPSFGVKQGCPHSPLLFAIYLNDIDSIADGVKGVVTGTPNFFGDPHHDAVRR